MSEHKLHPDSPPPSVDIGYCTANDLIAAWDTTPRNINGSPADVFIRRTLGLLRDFDIIAGILRRDEPQGIDTQILSDPAVPGGLMVRVRYPFVPVRSPSDRQRFIGLESSFLVSSAGEHHGFLPAIKAGNLRPDGAVEVDDFVVLEEAQFLGWLLHSEVERPDMGASFEANARRFEGRLAGVDLAPQNIAASEQSRSRQARFGALLSTLRQPFNIPFPDTVQVFVPNMAGVGSSN